MKLRVKKAEQPSNTRGDGRLQWSPPVLTRMRAGDAENFATTDPGTEITAFGS